MNIFNENCSKIETNNSIINGNNNIVVGNDNIINGTGNIVRGLRNTINDSSDKSQVTYDNESNNNVIQIHNGTGDNVGGKIVNN